MLNKTSTRAIILSGHGKHFCSGLDLQGNLKAVTSMDATNGVHFIRQFQECIAAPIHSHIPVISISHGVSYGLALDIISATTIRLCTSDVRFSIKEIDIGIMADIGSLQRLGYLVSNQSKLNELALTARDFGAVEAQDLGLVSGCFPTKDNALNSAISMANKIAGKYQPAVIGTKKHLEMMNVNSENAHAGLESVAVDNAQLMSSASYKNYFMGFMKQLSKSKAKL